MPDCGVADLMHQIQRLISVAASPSSSEASGTGKRAEMLIVRHRSGGTRLCDIRGGSGGPAAHYGAGKLPRMAWRWPRAVGAGWGRGGRPGSVWIKLAYLERQSARAIGSRAPAAR